RWVADAGPGSWREENPTGDARYWGPASWLRFLGGPGALDQRPPLRRLYTTRLDAFALAACALEMLAKLHVARCPPEAFKSAPAGASVQVRFLLEAERVRACWHAYWALAVALSA
ncbi:unnamed protein product, partial [Prorocentrum cordatum]